MGEAEAAAIAAGAAAGAAEVAATAAALEAQAEVERAEADKLYAQAEVERAQGEAEAQRVMAEAMAQQGASDDSDEWEYDDEVIAQLANEVEADMAKLDEHDAKLAEINERLARLETPAQPTTVPPEGSAANANAQQQPTEAQAGASTESAAGNVSEQPADRKPAETHWYFRKFGKR